MRWIAAIAALYLSAGAHGPGPDGIKGSLLVPFAPAGITTAAAGPKRLALIVGINDFEDERFPPLRFAQTDAEAMAKALGPNFDEVMLKVSSKDTSRTAILRALSELGAKASHPEDTVFIYFSSHGSLAREPGGALKRYLVVHDTSMALLAETGLPVEGLVRVIDAMGSRRKVLVLATCHSGKGKSQISDSLAQALASIKSAQFTSFEAVSEASIILTASAFGDTARESPELGHDIYTYFFLQAMKDGSGDRDQNGAVTASEAHDFARDGTWAYTQGKQRPTAESQILGRDPIVLTGKVQNSGLPVVFSYAPSAEGLEVCLNGQSKGALPGGVALPAGDHELSIRRRDTDEILYRGRMSLREGQHADLTELLPNPTALSFQADAAFLWPLLSSSRGEYLPMSFGAGLSTFLHNWPDEAWQLGLRLGYLNGGGQATGFDENLDFRFHALEGGLSVGYAFSLGQDLQLTPWVQTGLFWALRDFETDSYEENDLLFAFRFGAGLSLGWEFLDGWWLRAGLSLGALLGPLGAEPGPHPILGCTLSIGPTID